MHVLALGQFCIIYKIIECKNSMLRTHVGLLWLPDTQFAIASNVVRHAIIKPRIWIVLAKCNFMINLKYHKCTYMHVGFLSFIDTSLISCHSFFNYKWFECHTRIYIVNVRHGYHLRNETVLGNICKG